MKLKKISILKSKLIRLQLLKSKIYILNKNKLEHVQLQSIETHLKQALKIIYNYHINSKKIVFIGVPQSIQNILQTTTQHLFFADNVWIRGVLSNKTSIFKYIHKQLNLSGKLKKNDLKSLFKIQQNPELIVVFNQNSELSILQEVEKLQIPLISITIDCDPRILYKIPGNFTILNQRMNSILFFLICSCFKKSK